MKLIRSFLGAGLGASSAIWPAATWNEPWLLLFGGVIGWLMGYHGDRVVGSLIHGWRQARRVGFQTALVAAAKRSALMDWIIRSVRGIRAGFGWLLRLTWRIGSVEVPIGPWFVATVKWGVAAYHGTCTFPRRSADWYGAHPVNRATVLRFFAGLASASLLVSVVWYFVGTYLIPEVGSTMTGTNGKPKIVTESYVFWNTFGMTAFLGLFTVLITMIMLQDERLSMSGFYRIWERYASRGPVLFVLGEALRFLWIEVWLLWTAVSALTLMSAGFIVAAVGVMFAWTGIVFGLKLAWRAVCLNRDYGVVSLGIALLVGTITFYMYREDLVADAWFRLGASVVAGFVAGAASFLVTGLCGLLFRRSITVRRIAVRKDYLSSDNVLMKVMDTFPGWCWKQNMRLLPVLG